MLCQCLFCHKRCMLWCSIGLFIIELCQFHTDFPSSALSMKLKAWSFSFKYEYSLHSYWFLGFWLRSTAPADIAWMYILATIILLIHCFRSTASSFFSLFLIKRKKYRFITRNEIWSDFFRCMFTCSHCSADQQKCQVRKHLKRPLNLISYRDNCLSFQVMTLHTDDYISFGTPESSWA